MISPKLLEVVAKIIADTAVYAYTRGYSDGKEGKPADEALSKGLSPSHKLWIKTALEKALRNR